MVEYHTISTKDLSRLHQFGPKVLPSIFLGNVLYAGGIWKGDIMIADTEELEEKDAPELPRPKAQCTGSVNANERLNFQIPSRNWKSQNFLEKIRNWERQL